METSRLMTFKGRKAMVHNLIFLELFLYCLISWKHKPLFFMDHLESTYQDQLWEFIAIPNYCFY